jgi:hypothetical protein
MACQRPVTTMIPRREQKKTCVISAPVKAHLSMSFSLFSLFSLLLLLLLLLLLFLLISGKYSIAGLDTYSIARGVGVGVGGIWKKCLLNLILIY